MKIFVIGETLRGFCKNLRKINFLSGVQMDFKYHYGKSVNLNSVFIRSNPCCFIEQITGIGDTSILIWTGNLSQGLESL